jgi:hypothetical protein
MRKNFYTDKYEDKSPPLRTHYFMNYGIMEFSIRKLKKELKEIEKEITLEDAVDWLEASEMYTDAEIEDFISTYKNNFEEND